MDFRSDYTRPVAPSERIELLDALRGFALLGVVVQNLLDGRWLIASSPYQDQFLTVIRFLCAGKFRSLFALLFGIGFALQSERARRHGNPFLGVYLWRQLLLFAIGVAHFVFLFGQQDILRYYAVLGVLLIPFRQLSSRAVLATAIVVFALSTATEPLVGSFGNLTGTRLLLPGDEVRRIPPAQLNTLISGLYAEPSYLTSVQTRFGQFVTDHNSLPRIAATYGISQIPTFGMFLLGLYAVRRGWIQNAERNRKTWLWVFCGALSIVIGLRVIALWDLPFPFQLLSSRDLVQCVQSVLYATAFAMIFGTTLGRTSAQPFRWIGRMALSNYVFASTLTIAIYTGYGLGWHRQIVPTWGIALQISLFAVQAALSWAWFRSFQQGPLEWLWRSATWRRLQRLRPPGSIQYTREDSE